MSFISMMEAKLPPGFRFHPRDDELVIDYLAKKISGGGDLSLFFGCPPMIDVDLNKCEPWDLPEISSVGGNEWYFFSLRDRKYATGQRTNRATLSGYWKATGKDRHVTRKGVLVGMRKTLVFYKGRAPKGTKTDWVMHEFRMELPGDDHSKYAPKEDWVLCRVFHKSIGLSSSSSNNNNNKTSMVECSSYQEDSCSSSFPTPMETYITFDGREHPPNHPMKSFEGYEQVPCFSNASFFAPLPPASLRIQRSVPSDFFGTNQSDCDNKAIRAVLSQLTKIEGNQKRGPPLPPPPPPVNGYLCDNGMSSVW